MQTNEMTKLMMMTISWEIFWVWPTYCSRHVATHILVFCACQVLVQWQSFTFCHYLWDTWCHGFVVFSMVLVTTKHRACKVLTHRRFAFLSCLKQCACSLLVLPNLASSFVGNH